MEKIASDIILKPIITEDSMERLENGKYTFKVAKDATKVEIAKAVETLFDVKVAKVNTISVKGKAKRMGRFVGYRPNWKKAIVTVEGDKTIEFCDGMF
mgnify:CR=1 FL=1